jgi:hypothetical protein
LGFGRILDSPEEAVSVIVERIPAEVRARLIQAAVIPHP